MIYCKKCGVALEADMAYCPICGKSVTDEDENDKSAKEENKTPGQQHKMDWPRIKQILRDRVPPFKRIFHT